MNVRYYAKFRGDRSNRCRIARDEIPSGDKSPQKCIHSVEAQETAKHRAKFGWPPMNDVAAVTKARREIR